jgi:TPR repeat protein
MKELDTIAVPPPRPGRDHTVIVGPSKTGTTGVYSSVKAALQNSGLDPVTIFEPPHAHILDNVFRLAPERAVLAKTTMNRRAEAVPDPMVFDRRIMTTRDPRDILISSLLFRPLTRKAVESVDPESIEAFVAALERKEADPASLSVRDLFDLSETLGLGTPPFARMVKDFSAQRSLMRSFAFQVVPYEQLVADDLVGLSEYLGLAVTNVSDRESPLFGHISRSRDSGAFLNWFRPDDLTYFNKYFADALRTFGYHRDAILPDDPVVDPRTSSEYIRTRYEERRLSLQALRAQRKSGWSPDEVQSQAELDVLMDFARDGDALACVRVAEVLLHGRLTPRDESAALPWARLSAQLGRKAGIELMIELLGRLQDDNPALHRERRMWQAEYDARTTAAASTGGTAVETRPPMSGVMRFAAELVRIARSLAGRGLRKARDRASARRRR